jgi:hypothetical protein
LTQRLTTGKCGYAAIWQFIHKRGGQLAKVNGWSLQSN